MNKGEITVSVTFNAQELIKVFDVVCSKIDHLIEKANQPKTTTADLPEDLEIDVCEFIERLTKSIHDTVQGIGVKV